TVVASVVLLGITFAMVPFMKVDFIGDTGQNMVMVSQEFEPGSDLDTISDGAEGVEDTLLDTDGVEEVMLMAGSGDGSDDDFSAMLGGSGGTATYIVNTDADVDQTKLQNRIRTELEDLDAPGEVTVSDGAEGVEDTLLDTDGVEEVMLMAGSGDGSDDDFSAMLGGSGGTATYIVNTDADVDQTKLQNRIRTELEDLDAPGEVTVMDSA